MHAQLSSRNVRLMRLIGACLLALCSFQELGAQITYQVEPVDIDGMIIVKGGSVTTDGTLGPLSASNILAMSVDTFHQSIMVVEGGMVEITGGPATIDLTNAALSLEGLVEATPTGIRIVQATEEGESNRLALLGLDNGPQVTWSSAHFDVVFSGHRHTGFQNLTSVYVPPAGAVFGRLPDAGLIARIIPEPSSLLLAIIGISLACSRFRR
jgi:hypothetical protein